MDHLRDVMTVIVILDDLSLQNVEVAHFSVEPDFDAILGVYFRQGHYWDDVV